MTSRVIGVLLVLPATLLAGPLPAWAAPAEEDAAEDEAAEPVEDEVAEVEAEDPITEAQRLFDEGATAFETADYAAAIERWTQAYGLVPSVPEYAPIKAKLIANLATARERAYAVDGEVSHLKQAKILLESYREVLDGIYPNMVERDKELAWVVAQVEKIDAELQAVAEREAAAAAANGEDDKPRLPPGQGLIIGGSVLTGLGAAGLGVMVAGMVIGSQNNDISDLPTNESAFATRGERFAKGRLGNALAIAGAAGGGALLVTGVALLVVGVKKKQAAGAEREDGQTARATLVPMLAPDHVGLGLVGRF